MIDILRGQVSAQLGSSNTNDLQSAAVLAAGVAVVFALLVIRAAVKVDVNWSWWWYPLPAFLIPTALVGIPIVPASKKRSFKNGPSVAQLLTEFANKPESLEKALERVIKDLNESLVLNDKRLAFEERCMRWGLASLALFTAASIALYGWGLR